MRHGYGEGFGGDGAGGGVVAGVGCHFVVVVERCGGGDGLGVVVWCDVMWCRLVGLCDEWQRCWTWKFSKSTLCVMGKEARTLRSPLESAHVFIGLILPSIRKGSLRGNGYFPLPSCKRGRVGNCQLITFGHLCRGDEPMW